MSDSQSSSQNPLEQLSLVGIYRRTAGNGASVYPADAPIVDQDGAIQLGLSDQNTAPWCIVLPTVEARAQAAKELIANDAAATGKLPLPFCPAALFELDASGNEQHKLTADDEFNWVHRGTITAGFSVYAFIDAVTRGEVTLKPEYDQCEKLEPLP